MKCIKKILLVASVVAVAGLFVACGANDSGITDEGDGVTATEDVKKENPTEHPKDNGAVNDVTDDVTDGVTDGVNDVMDGIDDVGDDLTKDNPTEK